MAKKKEYIKLPGRVVIGSRAGLWLAKDHLLSVKNPGYSEEYKRFYFRDIQAVAMLRTNAGKIWNAVLAACGVMILLLTLDTLPIPVALMMGGTFLFFMILNIALGPTCKCYIQTAVNWERLPSLRRVRSARKALDRLRPVIREAQGDISREDVVTKFREIAAAPKPRDPRAYPAGQARPSAQPGYSAVGAPQSPPGNYSGKVHLALFAVLVVDGLGGFADIFIESMAVTTIGAIVSLSFVVLTIIALVKQQGGQLNKGMRHAAWASLIYACVGYLLSFVMYFYVFLQDPTVANDQFGMMRAMSYLDPLEHPFLLITLISTSIASITIGVLGLYYYSKFVARRERSLTPVNNG